MKKSCDLNSSDVRIVDGKTQYLCGTLSYTKLGLVNLFVWMLWGDFCYTMMEQLIPTLLPLLLKQHEASNLVIGLLVGSIPAVLDFFLCPIISTVSDRTRSRWGRRIPYMIFTAPFVVLFLVLTGWSDHIGKFLHNLAFGESGSPALTIIILLAVFSIGFQLFNMFVGSVFYYIFADVVPKPFMGRFMALFRLVGTAAGFCFQRYLLPFADKSENMPWIFTGVAMIYLVGCCSMCLRVKEGSYPPPEVHVRKSIFSIVKEYFRECFSMPFYVLVFSAIAINTVSNTCRVMFNLLFAKEELGLTVADYGYITSTVSVVMLFSYIPMGYLVDKFHPLRIYFIGGIMVIAANIFGYFWCSDFQSFMVVCFLISGTYVLQGASFLPLTVRLYPAAQYGQFCSAAVIVRSTALIIANIGAGACIDWFGYRFIFVWDFIFTIIATVILIVVYRMWKNYGGDKNYVAPTINDFRNQKAVDTWS